MESLFRLDKTKSARTDNPETLATLGTQDIDRIQEEFEESVYRGRTDNTMAKKSIKEQTTINKQSEYKKLLISPNPLTLIHIIL